MRKAYAIFCLIVLSLLTAIMAGEKRIVGVRVNNQVMLLRVDLANYAIDASTDGTNWSAIPGTSGAAMLSGADFTGNVSIAGTTTLSGMTATTVPYLDASKVLTSSAVTPAELGYLSGVTSAIQTQLGTKAASGANSDITSLTGLTTALSIAQGGTGLSSLGTAGQVLTVNSGATAAEWADPSGGMTNPMTTVGDLIIGGTSGAPARLAAGTSGYVLTGQGTATAPIWAAPSIDLSSYGILYDGNYARYHYVSAGIDDYVKLMIHADGTNGETTFTDSSSTARTITAEGTVSKSTSVKKIGTASASFGGGYLTLANDAGFDVAAGDFTIDFWMYPTSSTTRQALFFNTEDTYSVGLEFGFNGTRNIAFWATSTYGAWDIIQSDTDGLETSGIGATSIPLNEWTHVALVRSGNTWMLFINGVLDISRTRSGTVLAGAQDKAIGGAIAYRNAFSGYIDEFRFSKGIARWTSGFTPQEIAYSSTALRELYIDSSAPPYISAPASPSQGDILYYSGSAWAKQAIGTAGQVLTVNSDATGFEFTTPTNGLLIASGSGYALSNGSTGRGTVGTKAVSMEYSSTGSGYGATGANSTVGGGDRNSASASYSTVSGGVLNVASGTHSTVIGGIYNVASGNFSSIIGGDNNTASALYSAAGGYLSISPHYGGFSWGSGQFSGAGDCQKGWVGARIATSSTDAAILYLDGSSEKFTLVSGDHYSCKVHLIGAQADGSTGDYYALVKIKNVSGTTSISGTVRILEAWEGDASLGTPTIAITADDTNDCLQIAVTPANATATRWTAVVEYVKINY